MTSATNKRQSHGLTLPQSPDSRESVVSNILSSLATLDETAQLQWIQETSRQVDHERAYQRTQNTSNGNVVTRHEQYDAHNGEQTDKPLSPTTGVGYRDRSRNGSFGLVTTSAPSPAVPMGRPSKQGFFRRFMGIGPKMAMETDV